MSYNASPSSVSRLSRKFGSLDVRVVIRLLMVLTMMFNTRDYWVFGVCPKEHNVSGTESVYLLR
jgi:hypothetical protein